MSVSEASLAMARANDTACPALDGSSKSVEDQSKKGPAEESTPVATASDVVKADTTDAAPEPKKVEDQCKKRPAEDSTPVAKASDVVKANSSDAAPEPKKKKQKVTVPKPPPATSLVVFGLGNEDAKCRRQRHNVGDRIVRAMAAASSKAAHGVGESEAANGEPVAWSVENKGRPWILLPAQGTVNESGPSLKKALEALGFSSAAFLAISDDVALPLGVIRMRQKGSSGGHNGLKSIEKEYSQEYHRLRIGIGGKAISEHVVGQFTEAEESEHLEAIVARGIQAVEAWLSFGPEEMDKAMSQVNAPDFRSVAPKTSGSDKAIPGNDEKKSVVWQPMYSFPKA